MRWTWALALVLLAGCGLRQSLLQPPVPPAPPGATEVGSKRCADCHEEIYKSFQRSVHGRAASFETGIKGGCESCHGPGSLHVEEGDPGKIRSFARLSPGEAAAVCVQCHRTGDLMNWSGSAHAVAEVGCTRCHSIHKAPEAPEEAFGYHQGRAVRAARKYLLSRREPSLCVKCHPEVRARLFYPSHHPLKEGKMVCTDCHTPHGSAVEALLRTRERKNDLCFRCHSSKQGPFTFEHPPVVEDCAICHEAHGTVADNLLKRNEPYICLECHHMHFHSAFVTKDAGGNVNIGTPPGVLATGHNPVQMSMLTRCTQCHSQIHGSEYPSLSVPGEGKALTR